VAGFNLLDFDDAGRLTELSTARYDVSSRSFTLGAMS
jgi:hypothetical protein